MTSATEKAPTISGAPILWITGLSGSGKSTLARAFTAELRRLGTTALLLDGDMLRDALEGTPAGTEEVDHGAAMRRQRAWRLARLARMAAQQGVPVVVATISLLHAIHTFNRSGGVPYAEVLLQADLDLLATRNPGLYGGPGIPPPRDVVGLDIEAEYPKLPGLVIAQHFHAADTPAHVAQLLALWRELIRQGEDR